MHIGTARKKGGRTLHVQSYATHSLPLMQCEQVRMQQINSTTGQKSAHTRAIEIGMTT